MCNRCWGLTCGCCTFYRDSQVQRPNVVDAIMTVFEPVSKGKILNPDVSTIDDYAREPQQIAAHLFRHGARTPVESYPSDPHINETYYPVGRGSLTNEGKMMMFKVGQLLRHKYGTLLGDDYTEEIIFTRSTDFNRTKASALLVLAGLWPPSKPQKWYTDLAWIPIPVFSKPLEEEDLINPSYCQLMRRRVMLLPANKVMYNKYIKPHKDIFQYIETNSGLKAETLTDILEFYFTLKTESEYGLKLPEWTNSIFPEPLQTIVPQVYDYVNGDPIIESIQSGYLIEKILNDTRQKIKGGAKLENRAMYLYSAHDTNIGGMLHALKVGTTEVPDYGSAILFEIYRTVDQEHYVKVSHLKHPLDSDATDLTLPNCETFCPLEKFAELYDEVLPSSSYGELCNSR